MGEKPRLKDEPLKEATEKGNAPLRQPSDKERQKAKELTDETMDELAEGLRQAEKDG